MTSERYRRMEIMERAVQQMRKWPDRSLDLEMNIAEASCLVAVVQLALRHPEAAKISAAGVADALIRRFIDQIDPEHGDVYELLMMGFDPDCDQ
jgi:hypothetical protein